MSSPDLPDADEIVAQFGPDALKFAGDVVSNPDAEAGIKALEDLVSAVEDPDATTKDRKLAIAEFYAEHFDKAIDAYSNDAEAVQLLITRIGNFMVGPARQLRRHIEERVRKSEPPTKLRVVDGGPQPDEVVFHRGDELEVAKRMLDDHLGPHIVYDHEAVHVYDDRRGCWQDYETDHMLRVVQRYEGAWVRTGSVDSEGRPKVKPLALSSAFGKGCVRWVQALTRSRGFFEDRAVGTGFTNGFLRPDGRFVEKSPEHRLLPADVLPFEYRPMRNADDIAERCPIWLGFLRSIWRDDDDQDDKILLLHHWLGRAMLGRAAEFEKMLLLYGPGASNGKSTLLKVVRSAFHSDARSAVAPQHMGERFQNLPMAFSRINIVADVSQTDIVDVGTLKAAVSGDEIMFERKMKSTFLARPRAAHVWALNGFPSVRDKSNGFWRRVMILTFNRSFAGDPELDTKIGDKILSEIEDIVAACLYYAIEHRDYAYIEPISSQKAAAGWRGNANNVIGFASQWQKVEHAKDRIRGRDCYRAYKGYCKETGTRPLGLHNFNTELRRLGWPESPNNNYRGWMMEPIPGSDVFDIVNPPKRPFSQGGGWP